MLRTLHLLTILKFQLFPYKSAVKRVDIWIDLQLVLVTRPSVQSAEAVSPHSELLREMQSGMHSAGSTSAK